MTPPSGPRSAECTLRSAHGHSSVLARASDATCARSEERDRPRSNPSRQVRDRRSPVTRGSRSKSFWHRGMDMERKAGYTRFILQSSSSGFPEGAVLLTPVAGPRRSRPSARRERPRLIPERKCDPTSVLRETSWPVGAPWGEVPALARLRRYGLDGGREHRPLHELQSNGSDRPDGALEVELVEVLLPQHGL